MLFSEILLPPYLSVSMRALCISDLILLHNRMRRAQSQQVRKGGQYDIHLHKQHNNLVRIIKM